MLHDRLDHLDDLQRQVSIAEQAFHAAVNDWRPGASKWDFYRAVDAGEAGLEKPLAAHKTFIDDLHAYYFARDGERGFLGKKGL